ncbi:MAG: ABC transporter permease [Chloroflexi bacterium]|nr:ABC transporter permease [Chloroflexota bacterium]
MELTASDAVVQPGLVRRPRARPGALETARALWPSLFGFVLFFGVWELGVRVTNTPPFVVPAPSLVAGRFWEELPMLLGELAVTLVGASIGFVIGLVVGVVGAVIMVHSRTLERSLFPIAVVIKLIPFVALAPMLIVWLGYDVKPKIVLAALITFFPVLVNCITGLRAVDPLAHEFFRSMGASRWEILVRLRWSTSLPYLFAALKIVVHLAVIGAIVAEYFGSRDGIGLVILRTSESLRIQSLFATSLLLALLGVTLILVTNVVERRALYWHESVRTSGGRG